MPGDIRGGVHRDLLEKGKVTFVLRAPHKPFASLVGDFNDWDTRQHPMQTDGSGTWWVTLPDPGRTRYGYYVLVDDDTHAWIGDPYAAEVQWAQGQTPWGVHGGRQSTFRWTDGRWRTPALRDMVIYELCVRDFAGTWHGGHPQFGTFERMTRLLPHLEQLGVNAVELMPIQAFPGESSWGYNPVLTTRGQQLRRPDDFRCFVDAAIELGLPSSWMSPSTMRASIPISSHFLHLPMYGPKGEWWTR
ncbi:MAG: hypothetical protein H6639_16075 [Caldilineaceae bacterium]|nr:hypothetical protein [Caldilineaceae bacterium]